MRNYFSLYVCIHAYLLCIHQRIQIYRRNIQLLIKLVFLHISLSLISKSNEFVAFSQICLKNSIKIYFNGNFFMVENVESTEKSNTE